jgi:RNA polymerase sigma-70 factor (ECF subfamily)
LIKEIIQGCQKRQRKSQKELYKMFYAYGMSITLRYADSREQAAEVLNDAFMKVFTNIEKYDPDRPFKPWLRQIIVNTAINQYHKNQNKLQKTDLDSINQQPARKQEVLSGMSYDEIIEMVQQLSPAYRTVFNLYVIEGFKHKEIADMLDIAVGTSKSNLSKAKKNLQSIVEKNFI